MRHDFRTEFLVCLDLSQDVNYVVGRSPSMEGAREVARKARTIFPDDKVYITKEMVLRQDLQQLKTASPKRPIISQKKIAANPEPKTDKCKCGKKEGQCVGSLGCQCNPIAKCKKADKWESNPIDDSDLNSNSDEDELEDFEVEEDLEFEDEDEDGGDNEDGDETDGYESNPEEQEELEESDEGYQPNPDEDEEDEEDEEFEEDEDEEFEDEEFEEDEDGED